MSNFSTGNFPSGNGTIPATPIFDETVSSAAHTDRAATRVGDGSDDVDSAAGGAAQQAAGEAKDRVKQAAGEAKSQAADVASGAKDAGTRVASTTKDQASRVVGDAASQAKELYGQATEQLSEQAGTQQKRAASTLGTLSSDLADMREKHEGGGLAAELVQMIEQRAGQASRWLEQRSPEDVFDEVKQFAARRPGLFIAIAAGTGIVAARLTKALVADAKSDSTATASATDSTTTVTAGDLRTSGAPATSVYSGAR